MIERLSDIEKLQEKAAKEISRKNYLISLLGAVVDTIPYMVWAKDREHKFTLVNNEIMSKLLLTHDRKKVIGKDSVQIAKEIIESGIEYNAGEICLSSDEITVRKNKPCQFFENFIINGKPLYLYVKKTPLFVDGDFQGTVGIGHDITENIFNDIVLKEYLENTSQDGVIDFLKDYKIKYYFEKIEHTNDEE